MTAVVMCMLMYCLCCSKRVEDSIKSLQERGEEKRMEVIHAASSNVFRRQEGMLISIFVFADHEDSRIDAAAARCHRCCGMSTGVAGSCGGWLRLTGRNAGTCGRCSAKSMVEPMRTVAGPESLRPHSES